MQRLEEKNAMLEKTLKEQLVEQQKEYEEHIALLLGNDKAALEAASGKSDTFQKMKILIFFN